jgi:hypothetical protein
MNAYGKCFAGKKISRRPPDVRATTAGMWTSFGGSPRGNRTASADASVTRRMNYHERK